MKITFVYGAFENLGVEYLSAALKAEGHIVNLAYHHKLFSDTMLELPFLARFFGHMDRFIQKILSGSPDMVCFSVVTDDWLWIRKIAREIKRRQPGIITLAGGIHVTSVPEDVMRCEDIDFACRGEGEEAVVELADKLERGLDPTGIRNIYARNGDSIIANEVRPLIPDLDILPFPDKDLFYDQAPYFKRTYTAMATRGCPLSCPYCHHNVEKKIYKVNRHYFRKHSVERMVTELERAVALWDNPRIMFEDDMLLHDRQWALDFCRELKRRVDKPYMCIGHPSQIDDEMARTLAETGCQYIELGVQTFNERVKKDILFRPEKNMDIKKSLALLKKYDVAFNCDQLAGLPGDTEEDLIKSAKIYNRYRPNRIYFLFLTYYPETDMANYVLEQGFASEDELEKVRRGTGESTVQRGSVTEEIFSHFRFLYGFLPLMSPKTVNWLLEDNRYRKLPTSIPICTNLPDSLGALFFGIRDFRGKIIMERYVRHLLKLGY